MSLINLTLTDALQKLRAREITAVQLTSAYLDRIEKFNPELNAFITVTRERALADAAESDRRYDNGTARPLDGIPVGIKDNFATKGIKTTAGSRMLSNFIPCYESTVSQKLADAGCVLLGKTNMDEFAMYGDGTTSYFGATINPHKRTQKLTPGGSSSGSVAAVAGGLALAATGSDTGDSIRWPAAATGLVGMKPTYGLCSRFGCVAYASSLDHPGSIARTVDDCAALLAAMAGHDANDSTSAPHADEIAQSLSAPLITLPFDGVRVGVIRELESDLISADMKKSMDAHIENLRGLGAEIITVSIPHIMNTSTLYAVISRAEASSNLARYDGMRYGLRVDGRDLDDTYMKTRAAGFGDNVKFRLVTGAAMLTQKFYQDCFLAAASVRRILDNEFTAAFKQCDFLITPSTIGTAAQKHDARYSNALLVCANMSGLPAISVPCGLSDGLPLGLHIIGRRFDDLRVFQMAKHIENFAQIDNRPTTVMGE